MSAQQLQKRRLAPNQEAHLLLVQLLDRLGLNKRGLLDRLADMGFVFSDDDFANWGRAGRSFPRNWAALRAIVQIVTQDQPPNRRCTPAEALRFLGLVGMPFPELYDIAALFPADAFNGALAAYIPTTARARRTPVAVTVADEPREVAVGQVEPAADSAPRRGLLVLMDLLWVPEVREALLRFRIDFEAICRQIRLMGDYKYIHDLFQQLEDRYYLVYHDLRRLPAEPSAWQALERIEPELSVVVEELLERGHHAHGSSGPVPWANRLARMADELRGALEAQDLPQLKHAVAGLRGLISRELSRVNTLLVGAAGALRLNNLIGALGTIRDNLARSAANGGPNRRFEEFEQGIEALVGLHTGLLNMIVAHNCFQEIDDELRRAEALLEQDLVELDYAWQNLRPLISQLCHNNEASWAVRLRTLGDELERALAEQNPGKVTRLFRSCRSQAIRGFNQVDWELLALCDELEKVGESLALVLRMIA